jgi:hypothetical protein
MPRRHAEQHQHQLPPAMAEVKRQAKGVQINNVRILIVSLREGAFVIHTPLRPA